MRAGAGRWGVQHAARDGRSGFTDALSQSCLKARAPAWSAGGGAKQRNRWLSKGGSRLGLNPRGRNTAGHDVFRP